jgi:hypothetical protein
MLRVVGQKGGDCSGVSRRSFVQAGMLGLGGLSLADWCLARETAGAVDPTRDTSVILFWCSGGPGHMETWDPKPQAVDQYRGPFGAISTSVPGLQFGELLPMQAKIADKLAALRSVNHGSGDHTKGNHWMLTGFEGPDFNKPDFNIQRRPCMGSAVARLKGGTRSGLPPYVAVPNLRGGTDNFFHYAAYLGAGANPFNVDSDPNTPQFAVKNLALPAEMSFDRLEDRRRVLETLDQLRREGDRVVIDRAQHYQRAFTLLTSRQVAEAFDITRESDQMRDRYGRHTFGQSALLARRMVERGVPFVTVNCVPWDHHGTAGRYRTDEGAKLLIPPFDRAVATLVEDLIERGLYEKTLIVAMGEFGRTPKMNPEGGRDHWGHTFSVLMGCGSMRMGQAIGRSDARGEFVADRPILPQDVTATVFHHLGIDAAKVSFVDRQGRGLALVENGEPIKELL